MQKRMRAYRVGIVALLVGLVGLLDSSAALAAWQPAGPVRLLVGFREGGGADTLARVIARSIESARGWSIVVENVTGGGSAVMAKQITRAAPDGLTIGLTVSEVITYTPLRNPRIGYGIDDFTYLGAVARSQVALMARADSPWNSLADVLATARTEGPLTIAAMGILVADATRLIAARFQVPLVVVPVRGGVGGMIELIAGNVDLAWGAGVQAAYLASGDVKALLSAEPERIPMAPDAPTLFELGLDMDLSVYFMFVGPSGLPIDVASTYSDAIASAVQNEQVRTLIGDRLKLAVQYVSGGTLESILRGTRQSRREILTALGQ